MPEIEGSAVQQYAQAFRSGDVVVLESDREYLTRDYEQIRQALQLAYEKTGVRFVLLPPGMRVARVRSREHERDMSSSPNETHWRG